MRLVTHRCLEAGQRLGGVLTVGGREVGELRDNIMELVPDGLVFLGDGCELLGHPTLLMGDSDEPFDELGEEGDGGGFGEDGVGHRFGAEVQKLSSVEAEGAPGLGQLFHHEG